MKRELTRMSDWLVWALLAYTICITLRTYQIEPQVQIVLWKLGNLTVASYVGYWIDRRAFRTRIYDDATTFEQLRRAIIIGCAMLSVGLGL